MSYFVAERGKGDVGHSVNRNTGIETLAGVVGWKMEKSDMEARKI